jgi:uncharacterized protein (DUF1015 family)
MAQIHPFRAHRYNRAIVGDMNLVVTQPYDKISNELQADYYGRSPYNVVRITRSLEKNDDPATEYADAGLTYNKWIADGAVVQDKAPAIYAYYQDYEVDGERKLQRGMIALLDLKHSGASILPHERTLAEPKMDRLRLMRSIEGNDDLIYMLYTDDRLTVNGIMDEATSKREPEIEVTDDFGATHRLWTITAPDMVKTIQNAMIPDELFIADGHHRFETSINFMKECEAARWRAIGIETFDKRMVTCFNSADKGITILPTHRLIRGFPSFHSLDFLRGLEPFFEVAPAASLGELREKMKAGGDNHVFGFYCGDLRRFYLLALREEGRADPLLLAHAEAYRRLDVSVLHALILERQLGIDEKKLEAQEHVDYARDRESCVRRVNEGGYQAAFFLNPTSVEQMQRVALLGEKMPQKSTDFYPKLLTGLVFMKMRIAKVAD